MSKKACDSEGLGDVAPPSQWPFWLPATNADVVVWSVMTAVALVGLLVLVAVL